MDPAEQCLTPQHHIRSLLLESTGKTGHQQVITSGNNIHNPAGVLFLFYFQKFVYLASLPAATYSHLLYFFPKHFPFFFGPPYNGTT